MCLASFVFFDMFPPQVCHNAGGFSIVLRALPQLRAGRIGGCEADKYIFQKPATSIDAESLIAYNINVVYN